MRKPSAVAIVKFVTTATVGAGTAKIVHATIENQVEPETTTDKVQVFAATTAITSMAVKTTKEYTDAKIDEYVTRFRRIKSEVDNNKSTYNITTKK